MKPGVRWVQISLLLRPLQEDENRKFIQALLNTQEGGGPVAGTEINKTQALISSSLQCNGEVRQVNLGQMKYELKKSFKLGPLGE